MWLLLLEADLMVKAMFLVDTMVFLVLLQCWRWE